MNLPTHFVVDLPLRPNASSMIARSRSVSGEGGLTAPGGFFRRATDIYGKAFRWCSHGAFGLTVQSIPTMMKSEVLLVLGAGF